MQSAQVRDHAGSDHDAYPPSHAIIGQGFPSHTPSHTIMGRRSSGREIVSALSTVPHVAVTRDHT